MTAASVISFAKFKVKLGDGQSPETFSVPCGFTSRALNLTKNLNEVNVPDCDDEDAPSWIARDVASLSWGVTGEGVLAEESVETWFDWFFSTISKSVRIEIDLPTQATLVYEGRAHLSSMPISGNKGEKVTLNVELAGDGALVEVGT